MSVRAALLALVIAPSALAGQLLGGAYVGGGAGLLAPTGSFGDVEKAGWQLQLVAIATVRGRLGATVDVVFGQTTHQNGVDGKGTLGGAGLNAVLFLTDATRRLRPFVAAGAGVYGVNVDVPGFGSAAATRFGYQYGAGVLVAAGPRRLFVTARQLSVRTSPQSTNYLLISAGIVLPIGSP